MVFGNKTRPLLLGKTQYFEYFMIIIRVIGKLDQFEQVDSIGKSIGKSPKLVKWKSI